ncbi:MAG: hypothetical protein V3V08_16990 [Nannocystaceae bacterium]
MMRIRLVGAETAGDGAAWLVCVSRQSEGSDKEADGYEHSADIA